MAIWNLSKHDRFDVRFVESVEKNEEKEFVLDKSKFESMLRNPDLSGVPIVVVCIVGAMRTGKSLLLNLITTYYRQEGWINRDWIKQWNQMDSAGMPPFKSGVDAHSCGITAYGAPYILKRSDGKEIAVLLLDSEGLFDFTNSDINDASLFTFCSYVSSLQIFNKMKSFDAGEMIKLQFLVDIAKEYQAADNTDTYLQKPIFKDLCFMVRDWPNNAEYPFGQRGGDVYFTKLKGKLKSRRTSVIVDCLERSYEKLWCHVMPEPGPRIKEAQSNTNDKLTYTDLGNRFILYVERFISTYLHPDVLLERYASDPLQQVFETDLLNLVNFYGHRIFAGDFKSISTDPLDRLAKTFRHKVTTAWLAVDEPKWKDFDKIVNEHCDEAKTIANKSLNSDRQADFSDRLDLELGNLRHKFAALRLKNSKKLISEAQSELKKLHGRWFTNPSAIRISAEELKKRLEIEERDHGSIAADFQEMVVADLHEAFLQNLRNGGVIAATTIATGVVVGLTAGVGAFFIPAIPVVAAEIAAVVGVVGGTAAAIGVGGGFAAGTAFTNNATENSSLVAKVAAEAGAIVAAVALGGKVVEGGLGAGSTAVSALTENAAKHSAIITKIAMEAATIMSVVALGGKAVEECLDGGFVAGYDNNGGVRSNDGIHSNNQNRDHISLDGVPLSSFLNGNSEE